MCCGADMPNPLEWMPLGREPGCREAAMDPQNIKLFGQTISVPSNHTGAGADAEVLKPTSASPSWDTALISRQDGKGVVERLISARSSSGEGFLQPPRDLVVNVGSRLSDDSSEGHSKEQSEGDHSLSVGNDKNLPKPDKVVACPRCDSLDTKFCYYNNYNVNQPRHFCKNCQRYWTAGGTLRNVPVGAGRRKNKHGNNGALQRDSSCAEPSASPFSGSPTSQKGASSSFKQSQPKHMAGQSSPMQSPGSASSFGQESGITMSSPTYSFHQNGRLPFQAYPCSQGFMTSGTEASAVGSPDSASTLHQRVHLFPSGNGFDKDCSRSTLSGLMQDAGNLSAIQTAPRSQQLESSGTYRSVASSDITSGWADTDGPGRFFNGDYPNGYHLEWDGKQRAMPSSSQSFSRTYSSGPTPPPWNPAQWAYAPHAPGTQSAGPSIASAGPGISYAGPCIASAGPCIPLQRPGALHTVLGKRGVSDGGRLDGAQLLPAKTFRTDEYSRATKSAWPMLGRSQSDVNSTLKLFQPKLELAGACEQKDSFMGMIFSNPAGSRPVPFPVTI